MRITSLSFIARIRHWIFDSTVNWEIFSRHFPHLCGEKDYAYSFTTDEEMDVATEQFNTETLLAAIEQDVSNMPKSYGKSFRHIMHRDLSERLKMYRKVARSRVQRTCDSRLIAHHA